MTKTKAVLSALTKPLIADRLPDWVEPVWYASNDEAVELAPQAEIGWFDLTDRAKIVAAIKAAVDMKWYTSIIAGLDYLPEGLLDRPGLRVTNGAGINAVTIAEYVVMGMLSIAKGYRQVVRAQERREWLRPAPGRRELLGSKALILGYGAIGQMVDERLTAFGMDVAKVRRTAGPGTLGPDEWRARIGEFDWIIIAVPATPETVGMVGAAEIAAMKSDAVLVNVARGVVVDQDALLAALQDKRIGGAFLDVTEPEPLPPEHPLWECDNAEITMHLSGLSQSRMFQRGAERFLRNLDHYRAGRPLEAEYFPARGY